MSTNCTFAFYWGRSVVHIIKASNSLPELWERGQGSPIYINLVMTNASIHVCRKYLIHRLDVIINSKEEKFTLQLWEINMDLWARIVLPKKGWNGCDICVCSDYDSIRTASVQLQLSLSLWIALDLHSKIFPSPETGRSVQRSPSNAWGAKGIPITLVILLVIVL